MADCGASGSALDQAARMLVGQGNDSSKTISNLLGRHAVAIPQKLPQVAPDVLPSLPGNETLWQGGQFYQQHPHSQHVAHHHLHDAAMHHGDIRVAVPHRQVLLPHQLHHSTHNMHHQMMMQQHMNTMMAQQQHRMMQQQNAKSRLQSEQPVLGHEGRVKAAGIDELSAAWKEMVGVEENSVVGHEGRVRPVGIEELASAWRDANRNDNQVAEALSEAWAAAEEEYQQQYYNNEGEDHLFQPQAYEFRNKLVDQTSRDWMAEGMKQFEIGNMKDAILAFESELQLSNSDNALAWRMLGHCHAENDMDHEAILCFENAVDRDPYSVDARLSLGVSYLNELQHDKALEHLKAWITHNPQFADLKLPPDIYGAGDAQGAFDDVQHLLLRALNHATDSAVTAEIYEALGVVYNVSRDYDAAVDVFQKAIQIQPSYQLYNKLGATLANSSRSAEALPNYNKALSMKPRYARAWLNMAISYSNLEDYHEAARCYLQTLSLNPGAVHCWSYLRIALSCAERFELMPLVAQRDLGEFKKHFDFVVYDNTFS